VLYFPSGMVVNLVGFIAHHTWWAPKPFMENSNIVRPASDAYRLQWEQ
jgi:hypothetical protein